nr:DUF3662 domain-containing protein [Angustibacter aerolatus]
MGVLDRFEKGIERAVNGTFAKVFRSEVQPVEIASALRKAADEKAAVIGRGRTLVPNTYVVEPRRHRPRPAARHGRRAHRGASPRTCGRTPSSRVTRSSAR